MQYSIIFDQLGIINCTQLKNLDKKEKSCSHLKVFNCFLYALIDEITRDKDDLKSKYCYFIGYEGDEFGYRFCVVNVIKLLGVKTLSLMKTPPLQSKLRKLSQSKDKKHLRKIKSNLSPMH